MSDWKRALARTPDCISVERIGGPLTAAEREHLAHCARCETELALWEQFSRAEATPDEGAAVRWIAAETERRWKASTGVRKSERGWFRWPRLAAAASLVAIGIVGYVAWDVREPAVVAPAPGTLTYRSSGIRLIAPAGDVAVAPTELRWQDIAGAAQYEVRVEEVDGTVLWRSSTAQPRAALPIALVAQFAPGRTFVWRVTAKTGRGAVIAESETGRFRVSLMAPPRSD